MSEHERDGFWCAIGFLMVEDVAVVREARERKARWAWGQLRRMSLLSYPRNKKALFLLSALIMSLKPRNLCVSLVVFA